MARPGKLSTIGVGMPAAAQAGRLPAVVAGLLVSFVASVNLARAIRMDLLLDSEPSWAPARAFLWLVWIAGIAASGGAAAGAFLVWSRSRSSVAPLEPLPLSGRALALITALAITGGVLLRLTALERLPEGLWIDDLSEIPAALSLEGRWRDFANAVRHVPYSPDPAGAPGTVGVLYLEIFRLVLFLTGPTVLGLRLMSAMGGILSLFTAAALGRTLLPRGGGTLAALVLAGLRWSLILSRVGWVVIWIAPIADLAAIFLLRSLRRSRRFGAVLAGAMIGLGAHLYLSAWVAAAALALAAVGAWWYGRPSSRRLLVTHYLAGFLIVVAPLFLLREGRPTDYFVRTTVQNVFREMRDRGSPMPLFEAAADGLAAPWFIPEPRNDLRGKTRLGWILGPLAAIAMLRALRLPGTELSTFLLAHAAAALAATVIGGHRGVPNGFRFGYLSTVAAVAAAAGALWVVQQRPALRRRQAAIAVIGLLAVGSAVGARDTLLRWAETRDTFDSVKGQDTLVARAALRWEAHGTVAIDPALHHAPVTVSVIRTYRLDPDLSPDHAPAPGRPPRAFRIAPPGTMPREGESAVEQVRDSSGREWAVVLGRRI